MKYFCLGFLLAAALGAEAKPVDFDGGNITFNAPDDFTPLNKDEIAIKFPRRTGPMEAVGNDTRGVTICYSITNTAVQPDQLSDLKDALTSNMTKLIPGLQWIKQEFVEINGTKWIDLESITPAGDQTIHNIQLLTSYHGHMLAFNFNAASQRFAAYQDKLTASFNSIKIKSDVDAPPSSPASSQPSAAP